MLVSLVSSQVLIASYSSQTVTQTRAIEVGPHNHANFTVNVRDLPTLHGSPTAKTLTVYVEGSNGGGKWHRTGSSLVSTATGVKPLDFPVSFAFLRLHVEFVVTGSSGDEAEVGFCVQVNLKAL